MIIHDKSIFSANNSRRKIWTLENHGIFGPKRKGRGIMVSDFLLSLLWLNLFSLFSQQQKDLASSRIPLEAAMYFKYRKMEESYWTGKHLLD